MAYTAAVITISDKGAVGERIDTSGPAICEVLKNNDWDGIQTGAISPRQGDDTVKTDQILCKWARSVSRIDPKRRWNEDNIRLKQGYNFVTTSC